MLLYIYGVCDYFAKALVFACVQVCNTLGQCHCEIGFSPPDCSQPGGGGSYHSNPASLYSTCKCSHNTRLKRSITKTSRSRK